MTDREILEQAHALRHSGQSEKAIVLYDKILANNPENDEYLFGKALCYIDSDPEKSFVTFKRVLEINPDVIPAYENIAAIGNRTNNYNEAIKILSEGIKRFPNHLDLVYHRATLVGNAGNNLDALLDFYNILENSTLKDDPQVFIDHQISSDIALCKTQLRGQTLQKQLDNKPEFSNYEQTRMKEYQYQLPHSLFGDENCFIEFGKLMGRTINEVLSIQPDYIKWCILNLDNFCVSEEIIEILERKGITTTDCKRINEFKLTVLEGQKSKIEFDGDPPDSFTIDEDGNIKY